MNEEEIRHLSQSYYDIHQKYDKLQQENKQLKECYCNRTDCSGRIKNSREYDSLYQKYNKQKEAIDKVNLIIKGIAYGGSEDYYLEKINEIHRLLKEVSE